MLNINKSIKISLLCVVTLFTLAVNAQNKDTFKYYVSTQPRFLPATGNDTLVYALTGGLNAPQFNVIDMNGDNVLDLLIFDRHGDRLLTFINKGGEGIVDYYYAPEYESLFPSILNWVALRDLDNDGDMDIFTGDNGRTVVYTNTTGIDGKLTFALKTTSLKAKLWGPSPPLDTTKLYVSPDNYPGIEDLDNDGDLDFISFPATGGYLEMYKNYDVERGLPPGTLQLELADFCWGCFTEGASTNTVNIGDCQRSWAPKYYKTRHTSGTSILPIDLDGDTDKDLLLGNGDFMNLLALTNIKADLPWQYDSMSAYTDVFPPNTTPAHLDLFPAAFYLDVNNDGAKDLIVAASKRSNISEVNQVFYYKNTGTTANPVFVFVQNNFMQQHMVDFGGKTKPLFWDYDNDGDQDLLVANNGDYALTENKSDRLAFYENIGTAKYAIFRLKEGDFLALSEDSINSMSPALGDINGDGKPDLLIGDGTGNIRYYINTTSGATPTFSLQTTALQGINVLANAAPFVVDMDQDGRLDLIIGCYGGNILYYRNTGSKTNPAFVLEDDTLGNFIINRYRTDQNPQGYEKQGNSSPVVGDINADGIMDMVVGGAEGKVRVFTDIDPDNLEATFTEVDSLVYNNNLNKYYPIKDLGHFVTPAIADINDDGLMDIMIGNPRGGLMYYSSISDDNTISVGEVSATISQQFTAYPNPANNQVTITRELANTSVAYTFSNSVGQVIFKGNFAQGSTTTEFNTSLLPSGVYFISLFTNGQYSNTIKISVTH